MKFLLCVHLFFITSLVIAQEIDPKSFSQINSVYDEQSQVISPDGKVMYVATYSNIWKTDAYFIRK